MDIFDRICIEHDCDPEEGVSKGAFLQFLSEAFAKKSWLAVESHADVKPINPSFEHASVKPLIPNVDHAVGEPMHPRVDHAVEPMSPSVHATVSPTFEDSPEPCVEPPSDGSIRKASCESGDWLARQASQTAGADASLKSRHTEKRKQKKCKELHCTESNGMTPIVEECQYPSAASLESIQHHHIVEDPEQRALRQEHCLSRPTGVADRLLQIVEASPRFLRKTPNLLGIDWSVLIRELRSLIFDVHHEDHPAARGRHRQNRA
jgi:hypothetical protein